MLSSEELMQPRFKVVADYPFSPFEIGQVLALEMYRGGLCTRSDDGKGKILREDVLNDCPAIFHPLQWWEERAVEDLPEYVKVNEGLQLDYIVYPAFMHIGRWGDAATSYADMPGQFFGYPTDYQSIYHSEETPTRLNAIHFSPASLADYTAYQNQTK